MHDLRNGLSVAAGLLLAGTALAATERYRFDYLDYLPQSIRHEVSAINNAGQIAGTSRMDYFRYRATVWNLTEPVELDGGGSFGDRHAFGINDAGQVAGSMIVENNRLLKISDVVRWDNVGAGVHLDSSVGLYNRGVDINNTGHVLGMISGQNYVWDGPSSRRWLETPTGTNSFALKLNDAGAAVGVTYIGDVTKATVWRDDTVTYLDLLGHERGYARSINNLGQVVGWARTGEVSRAMLWQDGQTIDLGLLGGDSSRAMAINNQGQIIGTVRDDGRERLMLWNGAQAADLSEHLMLGEGWTLKDVVDINDHGWIIGHAFDTETASSRAFLLRPIPEPDTYALFFGGLGLTGWMVGRRRRRQA